MIARAHAHGIRINGATILPFTGSMYQKRNAEGEADRKAINDWIRAAGHFDAVIDLDKALRDPAHPEQMLPELDKGDHLHPSVAGHAAMAEAVPLSLFAGASAGPKIAFTFDDLPAHSAVPPGVTRQQVADKITCCDAGSENAASIWLREWSAAGRPAGRCVGAGRVEGGWESAGESYVVA